MILTLLFIFILWALQAGKLHEFVGLVVGPYQVPSTAAASTSSGEGGGGLGDAVNTAISSLGGSGGSKASSDGNKPVQGLPWLNKG